MRPILHLTSAFPPFPHYLVLERAVCRDSAAIVAADPWYGMEQSCSYRVS